MSAVRVRVLGLLAGLLMASACAAAPPPVLPLGGDFTLTDQDGHRFELSSQRGHVVLVFFGYTFCPDVCPTTLSKLSAVSARLGEDRKRVTTLYITVDPQRDTPAVMREHLAMFGLQAIGLTGSDQAIAKVAKQFGAAYEVERVDSEVSYTVAHTTTLYALDAQGRTRLLLPYEATVDDIVTAVRRIL